MRRIAGLKKFGRCLLFRSRYKIWWLLALCGIVDAMCAAMNLLMRSPDGSLSLRRFALPNAVWDMSMLAVVAGACAIAAGLSNSGKRYSWLLAMHGLALAAFGLVGVSPLVRGPLSFRPISLLFVVMSVSVGAFALGGSQTLRSDAPDRWFLGLSGMASIGFALSFIAVGFGWLKLRTSAVAPWIWMTRTSAYARYSCFPWRCAPAARVFPIRDSGKPCRLWEAQGTRTKHEAGRALRDSRCRHLDAGFWAGGGETSLCTLHPAGVTTAAIVKWWTALADKKLTSDCLSNSGAATVNLGRRNLCA